MEKLVSTLPGVKRGFENRNVGNAVRRTFQSSALLTTSFLEHLPANLYPLCRDLYREELARRAGSARVFTNTLSTLIHEAARMAVIFPNARFIFVKRNLEDNVLATYLRKYREGNAYAYDLKATRDHILWYHQMIELMMQKFPHIVRVIQYEDIIADPANALRIAAELCGIPLSGGSAPSVGGDPGCAAPYRRLMAAALEG